MSIGGLHDAQIRVTIAEISTWHAFAIVPGITHEESLALLTLSSHGVVVTLQTLIQTIRPFTVRVTIALTLNAAIGTDVAKVTLTDIGL